MERLIKPGGGKPEASILVRAAGERTVESCEKIVSAQIPSGFVKGVSAGAFPATLEASIHAAIKFECKWSVLLDADVLLRADAVSQIVSELETQPASLYMLNFAVLDRGFGGPAYAGVHAYRTERLSEALRFMDLARNDQRPETRLYKEMQKLGFLTRRSRTIVGLHDYEQFYVDLYRKNYVRAFKYRTQVAYMAERLKLSYQHDDEAKVMMWGLIDGLVASLSANRAKLDRDAYQASALKALERLGLSERPSLEPEARSLDPDRIIREFKPDALYLQNEHWLMPANDETAGPIPSGGPAIGIGWLAKAGRSLISRIRKGAAVD